MSSENPTKFDENILTVADIYSSTALKIQNILGNGSIASATIGAVMEEYNDRHENGIELAAQWIGDTASRHLNTTHSDILSDYEFVKSKGSEWRSELGIAGKLQHPVMLDVGVGNVQVYTAINLLSEYNARYPNSDPLGLKKYNNDYVSLASDLDTVYNSSTIKFASLMVEKGIKWGAQNIANWHTLSASEKEAFAVYFYNIGEDKANDKLIEGVQKFGHYSINISNTDIAQEYLINKESILDRMLPSNPRFDNIRNLIASGDLDNDSCFLSDTSIALFDGSVKPIEDIRPDDVVLSYDAFGNIVSGRVTRIYKSYIKHILDVFGLMVTPGHSTLCGDGKYAGRHVPIIDILRSDGALVTQDGSLLRACTNCPVGSFEDRFVQLAVGEMDAKGNLHVRQQGQVRIGTRLVTQDGRDISIADLLAHAEAMVDADGLVIAPGMDAPTPLHIDFLEVIPEPEDYVLKRSGLTLADIYQAAEWEAGARPQLPAPPLLDGGLVQPLSEEDRRKMSPNRPMRFGGQVSGADASEEQESFRTDLNSNSKRLH